MSLYPDIHVLGGGQLGLMLSQAAQNMGIHCHVLDRSVDAVGRRATPYFTQGDPQSEAAVLAFAQNAKILTFETEHVSVAAMRELEAQGIFVAPQSSVLEKIQNKVLQKQFYVSHAIPTAAFTIFDSKEKLSNARLNFPCIQKSALSGYDGYGVKLLQSETDLKSAFEGLSLVEEKVSIQKELAIIVARDLSGNIVTYDPVEMVFDGARNILLYQIAPARIDSKVAERARELAIAVSEAFQITGLLAVEMFWTIDDKLLVNEVAPRPHNSGHHTIEAYSISQYEMLIRILMREKIIQPILRKSSLMMNILGFETDSETKIRALTSRAMAHPDVHIHYYGKSDLRAFRKLGHITIMADDEKKLIETYRAIRGDA